MTRRAPADGHLAVVRTALGADEDVAFIHRYGTGRDQIFIIGLSSGVEVRFERPGDIYNPDSIVQVASDAGLIPTLLKKADALNFAQALIAVADVKARTDVRDEVRALLDQFLRRAEAALTINVDLGDSKDAYLRTLELRDHRFIAGEEHVPVAYRSAVLLDKHGDRYVRVEDLAGHFREQRGRAVAYTALKAETLEAGWRWPGRMWKRKPVALRDHLGPGVVHINAAVAAVGWEFADVPDDLPDELPENEETP